MNEQPILSEDEWTLVAELLSIEQSELPVEIRHCRSASMRDDLHRRLKMVEGLLQRLRQPLHA